MRYSRNAWKEKAVSRSVELKARRRTEAHHKKKIMLLEQKNQQLQEEISSRSELVKKNATKQTGNR
jgi:hypothetical protein